jgi:FAD synthase
MTQAVCILGVTGSIGQSTLKVLARHPDQYSVYAVSAYSRLDELVEICKKYSPKIVVVPKIKALELEQRLNQENLKNIEILTDEAGLIAIAEHDEVDIVMAAIVGAAGLLPTANIDMSDSHQLIPAPGVYAVKVHIDGENKCRHGMMNIGRRPTFGGDDITLEINIFDFSDDIYDRILHVSFIHRIREERKFNNALELASQLKDDRRLVEEQFLKED